MNLLPNQSLYNYMNCLKDKSCDSAKCVRRWILSSLAIVVFGRLSNGIFGWQTVILLLINVGLLVVALKKVKGGYTQFANYFSFGGSWLAVSLATNFYAYHLYAKQAERPRVWVCIVTSLLLLLVVFGAGYRSVRAIQKDKLHSTSKAFLAIVFITVIASRGITSFVNSPEIERFRWVVIFWIAAFAMALMGEIMVRAWIQSKIDRGELILNGEYEDTEPDKNFF